MLVSTDKQGRFNILKGYWRTGLSAEQAAALGATQQQLATARARHEALSLDLPRYDGKRFDGWGKRDTVDYLVRSLEFTRSEAKSIMEVARLIHAIERATGIKI